jgi:hypothetical protein
MRDDGTIKLELTPMAAKLQFTTIRAIDEIQGHVGGNRRGVPNFAKARAAGWRISTAQVESVMNHLINHRLGKRQQMRWSPAGAPYLLQVRVDVLNSTLLRRGGMSGYGALPDTRRAWRK